LAVSIETLTEGLTKLINKFEADRYHYLSKDYPEAQARIDFITPFFQEASGRTRALGTRPPGARNRLHRCRY